MSRKYPPAEERFASKFTVGDPEECWEWTAERLVSGYGIFRSYVGGHRTQHLAHRLALAATGADVTGMVVRHKCDNPPCVNPNHLELGTQADNVRDAVERQRNNVSGLFATYEKRCRHCGSAFVGEPQRHYCAESCLKESLRLRRLARKKAAA